METTLLIGCVILTMVLWFWAIIDIIKSRFKNRVMKTIWFAVVLFFPVLGSIFYFQLRKKYVVNGTRKFNPNFNRVALKQD